MNQYSKYKPTKIKWYPEIPESWDYCKVKHIANTYAGGTPSTVVDSFWNSGDIPWLPSGKLQNGEITTAEKFITEEGLNNSSTKWIKPNTVLIALTGATCANIGYLTFNACANQSVVAIDEDQNKANSRFLYFMFLSMRSQILTHQTGGAQAGINDGDVKNLYLLKPSLEEQTQIATFLDYKTNLIDATIEKKKRLIELLKEKRQAVINEAVTKGLNPNAPMKNSGVEWLGEIPEHWKVKKLKYLAKIKNGKDQKEVLIEEGGYPVLGTGGVFGRASAFLHDKPSVLLGRKGTIDKPFYIEEPFWTVDTLFYTEIYDNTYPKFLYYLSTTIKFEYYQESSAVPSMTQDNLNNIHLCYPPYEEQINIVNFINDFTSKVDLTLNKISTQIECMQNYRQSLISEAVTGKIDVRDWKPNKN